MKNYISGLFDSSLIITVNFRVILPCINIDNFYFGLLEFLP